MEDMILLGQLQINSIFKYRTILSCHLQARYGEMTRLTVSCVVDYQEVFDAMCRMQEEQVLSSDPSKCCEFGTHSWETRRGPRSVGTIWLCRGLLD